MARRITVLFAAAAVVISGCAAANPPPQDHTSTAADSAAPLVPVPVPVAPAPAPVRPSTVHAVTAAELGATWRSECPASPAELRRVEVDYLSFDGAIRRGNLVVNRDVVDPVVAIFGDLLQLRYPIERMQTVDRYPGADDELSMQDNNTSAFNCRALPGGTGWSFHAYGRAIDINPLVNPFIDAAGNLEPATARPYLDRTRDDLGLLRAGDAAVQAFTDRGWRWGGNWKNPIDYQHFEFG